MKLTYFILFLLINSITATVQARDWSSYSSENFTLYSDVRPTKAVELLQELEIFRELAFFALGMRPQPSNNKLQILMYSKKREYRRIGPENSIGFFTNTSAGPRMVIGSGGGSISRNEILYHEYIHYLMREHSPFVYPRWYDEGLAEVLGATTIKGNKATIGAIPEGRSLSIRYETPIEVSDLLEPDPEDDSLYYQSRFYAYAWLLTHYLEISKLRENPELNGQTSDYLLRLSRGEDPQEAFIRSYGLTPDEMDRVLRAYRNQRRITVLTLEFDALQSEIAQAGLSPGEQVYLLADIAWRVGEEEVAREYLDAIDPDDADFARALSLAAVLENHQDDEQRILLAKDLAEKSLALAPDDAQVLTNYAHWLSDSRNRQIERKAARTAEIEASIQEQVQLTGKAINIDPSNVEAMRFQWQGQIENGENLEALKSMMLAYQEEPFNVGINYTVGYHLLNMRRSELALPFIERVVNWSHSPEQRREMSQLLEEIKLENGHEENQ